MRSKQKRPAPGATARVDINAAALQMDEPRFWSRVEHGEPEQCWPWKAGRLPKGYGICSIAGKSALAHRVAYVIGHGAIPAGLIVRHRCDNPSCCNPSHLVVGTYAENEADKKRLSNNGDATP